MADVDAFMQRISALPPERVAQGEDLVDCITRKARQRAARDRPLACGDCVGRRLAATVSDADIRAEIAAVRAERRHP